MLQCKCQSRGVGSRSATERTASPNEVLTSVFHILMVLSAAVRRIVSSGDHARQDIGSECSRKTFSEVKPVCERGESQLLLTCGRKGKQQELTNTFQMIAVLSLPAVASHLPSCENSRRQISSSCSRRMCVVREGKADGSHLQSARREMGTSPEWKGHCCRWWDLACSRRVSSRR